MTEPTTDKLPIVLIHGLWMTARSRVTRRPGSTTTWTTGPRCCSSRAGRTI